MITTQDVLGVRVGVPTRLTGKLVRIHEDDETHEGVFGIHLGCYCVPKWDPEGEYIFHIVLSCGGGVRKYCFRTSDPETFEVIS